MRKSFVAFFIASSGCALLILDQVIKMFFMTSPYGVERFWIFGPASLNVFLPFGIPFPGSFFWILVIVLLLMCVVWLVLSPSVYERMILFCVVVAGTSNVFDRIRWGGVVDYIHIGNISVINGADIVITVGVIILLIMHLYSRENLN